MEKNMNATGMNAGNQTPEMLRQFIERVERPEEEKAGILADIRDVYSEAKGYGFDPKIMRQAVKLRAMDKPLLDFMGCGLALILRP